MIRVPRPLDHLIARTVLTPVEETPVQRVAVNLSLTVLPEEVPVVVARLASTLSATLTEGTAVAGANLNVTVLDDEEEAPEAGWENDEDPDV